MAVPIVKVNDDKQGGFTGLLIQQSKTNYFNLTGVIFHLKKTLSDMNIVYRKDIEKSILKTD